MKQQGVVRQLAGWIISTKSFGTRLTEDFDLARAQKPGDKGPGDGWLAGMEKEGHNRGRRFTPPSRVGRYGED